MSDPIVTFSNRASSRGNLLLILGEQPNTAHLGIIRITRSKHGMVS